MSKHEQKTPLPKNTNLFVFEGKNDFLIIGVIFLLLAFFLLGGFFLK